MPINTRLLTLGIIATMIVGACGGYSLYQSVSATKHTDSDLACVGSHKNHEIVIRDDQATPSHIDAKLCDTIKFTNKGGDGVLIAFGEHESHTTYDGVTEHMLNKSESFAIVANRPGSINFHDHIQDKVAGDITIAP